MLRINHGENKLPEQLNEYGAFKGKSIDELVKNYQKYDLYDLITYVLDFKDIDENKRKAHLEFLRQKLAIRQQQKFNENFSKNG